MVQNNVLEEQINLLINLNQKMLLVMEQVNRYLQTNKSVLNVDDVAVYTGFSKSHIYHLVSTNKLKHYKPAGRLFFKKEEVDEYLTNTSSVDTSERRVNEYFLKVKNIK